MEPIGDVANPASLDPESLGFMCGIEVHQQLATGKLHSRQAGELHDITIETLPEDWQRYYRKLRSSSGEGGAVDVSILQTFKAMHRVFLLIFQISKPTQPI